jgi:CRP-like cAMP-binding protein
MTHVRDHELLCGSPLFSGISVSDVQTLLNCLPTEVRNYEKGGVIAMTGDAVGAVGVVISGSVCVQQEDFWGNRTIMEHVAPGGLFNEAFACAGLAELPVTVVAVEKSRVLFADCRRILTTCSSACQFHTELIKNMVQILARENIMLTKKIEHMSRRTTREKLLCYLSSKAKELERDYFEIPFNRQQLADYLAVDRSALSAELSRMRKEGILDFNKNAFKLARRA